MFDCQSVALWFKGNAERSSNTGSMPRAATNENRKVTGQPFDALT